MRVLKPSSRPAISFGILYGLLLVVAFLAAKPSANLMEGLKGLLVVGGGIGLLLGQIYLSRITVGDNYIAYRAGFSRSKRIDFSEIGYSKTKVLAERSHPLFLDIFDNEHENSRPATPKLRIRLKPFRKTDVEWLLSLPQLKVRTR
jgi:hypothetical protein